MITAIILTKNEEKNIKACLDSLSWCDERLVIDDQSDDGTVEIAQNAGAQVFVNKLKTFSHQRNFALEKAKNDWILFIDADERISQSLWYEIVEQINDPFQKASGFYVKRIDMMWGRQLRFGECSAVKLLRVAKKGSGKWIGDVHEAWKVAGRKELLNNPLLHYPHQSIAEFLEEINYYTDIRARELYKNHKKTNIFLVILYPKAKFLLNYFLRLGILDGMPGLITALMMSFHSFLVRAKLYFLWQKSR